MRTTPAFESTFETLSTDELESASGAFGAQLTAAMHHARELGLQITATTNGKHAPHSYHYSGRAVDVAGSSGAMRQFYKDMARTHPTELFYDPMGAIKNGHNLGHSIGGHGTHVHLAY